MINLNEMSINLNDLDFFNLIYLLQTYQIMKANFPIDISLTSKIVEKCTEQSSIYETMMSIR